MFSKIVRQIVWKVFVSSELIHCLFFMKDFSIVSLHGHVCFVSCKKVDVKRKVVVSSALKRRGSDGEHSRSYGARRISAKCGIQEFCQCIISLRFNDWL